MIQTFRTILLFYRKLFLPTLVLSLLLGWGGGMGKGASLKGVSIALPLIGTLLHYLLYEIGSPNEYYFYHNLGLSKRILWISVLIINCLMAILFSIL